MDAGDSVTPAVLIEKYFEQFFVNVREEFAGDDVHAGNVIEVFLWALNAAWELLHQHPPLFNDHSTDNRNRCYHFIAEFLPDLIAIERNIHTRLFAIHADAMGHPDLSIGAQQRRQSVFKRLLTNRWNDIADCWICQMKVKYRLAKEYIKTPEGGVFF